MKWRSSRFVQLNKRTTICIMVTNEKGLFCMSKQKNNVLLCKTKTKNKRKNKAFECVNSMAIILMDGRKCTGVKKPGN